MRFMIFEDRSAAGQWLLSRIVLPLKTATKPVIVALPRGGVEVAAVIAKAYQAPVKILNVKKIPFPGNPEFAIGALAPDGSLVIDQDYRGSLPPGYLDQQKESLLEEIRRRQKVYGHVLTHMDIFKHCVILVDDGAATGYTALVAAQYLRALRPKQMIIALPVMPKDVYRMLAAVADDVVGYVPESFGGAVGGFYERFDQLSDQDVISLMERYDQK